MSHVQGDNQFWAVCPSIGYKLHYNGPHERNTEVPGMLFNKRSKLFSGGMLLHDGLMESTEIIEVQSNRILFPK